MLVEFEKVMQEAGVGRRRWFHGFRMELIIWHQESGAPAGFQICYTRESSGVENALTWRPETGFSHAVVDSGDARPDKNMTPVLIQGGEVPWSYVQAEFERESVGLAPELRNFVLGAFRRRSV
jgi:hypothetical protein